MGDIQNAGSVTNEGIIQGTVTGEGTTTNNGGISEDGGQSFSVNTLNAPQIGNLLVLTSNRIINVPVQHAARAYGKSGYSFKRLLKDLIYDITAHTAFPLLMVRNIGIVSFLVSMVMAVYFLIRYFAFGISVEGWTSLMLVMLAFFGLILLSIGIMGIYLMNILNEAKKMPHYVIRREDTD